MGTRGLTCVIHREKPVVAQYWGYDNYPSYAGVEMLKFAKRLSEEGVRQTFEESLDKSRLLTEEEFRTSIARITDEHGGYSRTKLEEIHPQFYMPGFELLHWLADGNSGELEDSYDFAADSLFCEWCYVIDLDKDTFEVYEGFNKHILSSAERFHNLDVDAASEYQPVRHLNTYKLDNLPDEEKFLNDNKDG